MSQLLNRMKTTPVPVQRTTRVHDLRVLTSLPAGKMVPLAAIPLLREDSVTRCQIRASFEMMETAEILLNAVNVSVKAYLVSNLCFERFSGMDSLNRSYKGIPEKEGDPVVPFFDTMSAPAHGANAILTYMGKHARVGTTINTAYIEAYNQVWNFRAKNRSPDITLRDRLDGTLAPAFWLHTSFAHIVPDFDQAIIDGEVPLNVVKGMLPVRGLGLTGAVQNVSNNVTVRESDGTTKTYDQSWAVEGTGGTLGAGEALLSVRKNTEAGTNGFPAIFAEMAENGITVSLSNIDAARKTQAFARLRAQYHGHSDEYIIDMLMDGLSVPDQAWKQPMLLSERISQFGMAKRYASDAANLTESVVNGGAMLDLSFSVPRCPMGGVVILVAEVTPEQLFERMKDSYLYATDVEQLPEFMRDTLDPEKVTVVPNDFVDLDHDTPDATFGYAPLNHEWTMNPPQIGGRFYRPVVDAAFDEDRQRIWAVETVNPVLSQDFYLCTTMHQKPFVVTNQDPFEAVIRGTAVIKGNTVFGGNLIEANDDYDIVAAKVPQERVAKSV